MNGEGEPQAAPEEPEATAPPRAAVRVLRSKVDPNDPVCALMRRVLAIAAEGKFAGVGIVLVAKDESDESDEVDFAHIDGCNIHAIASGARQLDEVIRQSLYATDE